MGPARRGVKIPGTRANRPRYLPIGTLPRIKDRDVALARDSLTGRAVVLKTRPADGARHEGRCLLALPAGVGPRLIDLVPSDRGRVTLVLESIAGNSLRQVARRVPVSRVSVLVRTIAHALADVHRFGWVHADLSPDNVIVRRTHEGFEVRLLDFDLAIDQYGAASGQVRGGRPEFIAPEVAQGWLVDGRADLYSLGAVIQKLWPAVRQDPRWKPILSGLLEVYPADRPRDAVEVEDEVTPAFSLGPALRRWPRFPSGPLQGRADEIEQALERLRCSRRPRLLVQARPGTGLTRFLQEVALAHARPGRPRLRVVDLGEFGEAPRPALEYLQECVASTDAVLCGVPDPSPGLHWLDAGAGDDLRTILAGRQWIRLQLPALDETTTEELVLAALGERCPAGTDLARVLRRSGEGDLHVAQDGFASAVRACGVAEGSAFRLDQKRLSKWSQAWRPGSMPVPTLESVPKQLRLGLRLCATLGRSFPAAVADELLRQFAPTVRLDALISHGYLRGNGDQLEFITHRLWSDAATRRPVPGAAVDAWLVGRYRPDPGQVDGVLAVCRAARRLGATDTERTLLSLAFEEAERHRRWDEILRMVAHPSPPPSAWTARDASRFAARASALLGPSWSVDRLLTLIGSALVPTVPHVAAALLESGSRSAEPRAAVAALLVLADRHADDTDGAAFVRLDAALRSLPASEAEAVPVGVLDHLTARRAYADRRPLEAAAAADRAQQALDGTGRMYEALNLQTLAVLRFPTSPAEALDLLKRAAVASDDTETRAQVRYNLSLMLARTGDLRSAALCSSQALHEAQGRVSPARELSLRIRRAWDRANADQIESATQEALSLLERSAVRESLRHLIPVRLLLGYCLLHRGQDREAVRLLARAWQECGGGPSPLRAQSLRSLLDALIDAGSVGLLRSRPREFSDLRGDLGDTPPALVQRVRALTAQADDRPQAALKTLRDGLDEARRLPDALDRARYLHHLALLSSGDPDHSRSLSDSRTAIRLFEEELVLLPTSGRGYYRAVALLGRAVAERRAGRTARARSTLVQATALARDIRSRRVLRRALRLTTSWSVDI